jgi:hypothetical protein
VLNILPGLRDVRAPLAAGYLWLLALYVAFEPLVPRKPHGIWQILSHLEHTFSVVGLGLAVSFFAYLMGAISQSVFGFPVRDDRPSLPRDPGVSLSSYPRESYPEMWPPEKESWWKRQSERLKSSKPVVSVATALGPLRGERIWSKPLHGLRRTLRPIDRLRKVQARLVGLSKHSYSDVGEAALEDMARTGIEAFSVAVQRAAPGCDADEPVGFVLAALDRRTRDRSTASDAVLQTLRLVENLVSPGWPYSGPRGMAEIDEDRRRRYFEVEFKKSVLRELRLARSSLVGEQPALFSEVDRIRSEAEFRAAVVAPLIGLGVTISWRADVWASVVPIVAAIILGLSARVHLQRANDSLLDALRLGRATCPTVDRLQEATALLEAHAGPSGGMAAAPGSGQTSDPQ